MKELSLQTELIAYRCGNCGSTEFKLFIGHRTDKKTFLIITCANERCVERRRRDIGAEDDALLVWNEFDITGQGKDEEEIEPDDSHIN